MLWYIAPQKIYFQLTKSKFQLDFPAKEMKSTHLMCNKQVPVWNFISIFYKFLLEG